MKLNSNEQALLDLLLTLPPDTVAAERFLRNEPLSSEAVTRTAIAYAEECFCEVRDWAHEQGIPHPETVVPGLHSTYIVDVIRFLLQHGLDPNEIHDDDNIMDALEFVDNESLAADALTLLLEHGGDPNLMIPGEGEPLFDSIDFDAYFAALEQYDRQLYTSLIHYWMVLLGYGGYCSEDRIRVFKEYDSPEVFDLKKLRNHRNYYFGLMHLDRGFVISIYDKQTLWETARIQ